MSTTEELEDRVRMAAARAIPRQSRAWWHNNVGSCGRTDCLCTHTAPCDRGWLDMPPEVVHQVSYERVAPCPVCRPDAARRYERHLYATSKELP